ncbi:MAG: DNA polymerase III subunit gamma/tau, partial [Alphaproteobacteria bacterium]|nr:DNA polymerase III subunit gamma/tau [Alphaproteobacteria bacterium]
MTASTSPTPYRVLARKYRPTDFSALIGQEAMVRTLTNAIRSGRLAHAFVLTGVRGVGKTTTARIIARALNCVEGPTIDPCGVCEHCRSIAEDRHVDVLEMDAASRTGVGDMRELIEGVRYRPTSARFKIYIIDEVHMLSNAAFNALLKTLEEPPEHVKFVFATTELRKIPVTVLSRCQRFDLRRVDIEELAAHFARIAEKEGATVEDAALKLIARAADGSVRDGLSLLDQAIAHCGGAVGEAEMRDMLGLADRARVFDLADALFKGDAAAALAQMGDQYAAGADPVVVLEDLLELVHWLTRLKVAPGQKDSLTIGETERVRGGDMAQRLGMGALTRAWQILLKGLGEARGAPSPLQAAEMALIRLTYAADLPSPAEVIEALRAQPPAQPPSGGGGGGGAPARG